ncbi:MAG: putative zinc-binding metallopeptidase [Phycisphaerales bacterium]|nr:putative zinc-binding metallopeptidase [Planctomycetota bacterium]MCH8509923.1 putative zinc-binding metallopeptidase [Phycisphaerales bacterium]
MPSPPRRSRAADELASMADDALLAMRLRDLPVSVDASPELSARVQALYDELADAGLLLRPKVWLSDEWFSPDAYPGIAIPFYLAHPRLKRLERKMMLEAEGGSRAECMKILRHEAGHAVQTAFRLHRRKAWREHFGDPSLPYPESYTPRPYSRRYVLHIDPHYAQAHPAEDFAETFAVWLTPGSRWRTRYKGWGALRKLEYVDALMGEIAGRRPAVRPGPAVAPLRSLAYTLAEHYRHRQSYYGIEQPDVYTRDLRRLFRAGPDEPGSSSAPAFLRAARRDILRTVARWTGQYQYTLNDMYQQLIDRCAEHALRIPADEDREKLRREIAVFLTVMAMNEVRDGGLRIVL